MAASFAAESKLLDAPRQWGAWLSEKASPLDTVAIATLVLLYYCYRAISSSDGIPLDFWYSVPQSSADQTLSRQKKAEARNIATVAAEKKLDAIIFWGSQSGRAETLARRLAKSLEDRFGLQAVAADLEDYDHGHLPSLPDRCLLGFVLSTYGDGDPPDNTTGFWTTLRTMTSGKANLENLRYIIFGLGNSNYRLFNQVAKTVDSTFQSLGATRYGALGHGDDAKGETENDFLNWRQSIEEDLKSTLNLTERSLVYQPAFDVSEDSACSTDCLQLGEPMSSSARMLPGQNPDSMTVRPIAIEKIRKLWEDGERLCLHIDLDLGADRVVKYKTGDHMAIWPSNPDYEVERMLSVLGLAGKGPMPIYIKARDTVSQVPLPSPTSIEALFRHYLEICGPLSLEAVAALAQFAPSKPASTRLLQIANQLGTFKSEVIGRHLTMAGFLEMLGEGASWQIPISFFIEHLRPMQPRYYSISSSTVAEPRSASLTVVANKPTAVDIGSRVRHGCYGLATTYLHALERSINGCPSPESWPEFRLEGPRAVLGGCKVFGRVRQSVFKLPTKASTPIIMIGAGTGVAPLRAFTQERVLRQKTTGDVGKTLLFMGFRHQDVDFIYRDEWETWQKALGTDIFKYWTAFSRSDPTRKAYVQDQLAEQSREVMDVLEKSFGSRVYICGSAHMARDVATKLAGLRSESVRGSKEEGLAWVKKLRQDGRLLEDVWG